MLFTFLWKYNTKSYILKWICSGKKEGHTAEPDKLVGGNDEVIGTGWICCVNRKIKIPRGAEWSHDKGGVGSLESLSQGERGRNGGSVYYRDKVKSNLLRWHQRKTNGHRQREKEVGWGWGRVNLTKQEGIRGWGVGAIVHCVNETCRSLGKGLLAHRTLTETLR